MKEFLRFFSIILCLCLMFGLVACNIQEPLENSAETDHTVYTVSCDPSDYYTLAGTTSATGGQTATVSLKSNFPAYEIIGCTYNGNECTKTSADDAEEQKYSYTMPQSNVVLKVSYRWKDLATAGHDNFLSFDSSNAYSTTSAAGDSTYNNDENWGAPLVLRYTTNAAYMTIADISCISTNESVLPSSAISTKNTLSASSNIIVGGRIIIDRSKAAAGTTQIVLRVKNQNNNAYDAIIVATVIVTV